MRLLTVFAAASVSVFAVACENVEGNWSGKTESCEDSENDDVPVTIVVDDGTATLATHFGFPDTGYAIVGNGGSATLEDASKLVFETEFNSDSLTIEYVVDLIPSDDRESHTGSIIASVNGAGKKKCELTVTR